MKNEKLLIAIITLISIVILLAGIGLLLDKLSNGRIEKRINNIETIAGKLEENQQQLESTVDGLSATTGRIEQTNSDLAKHYKSIGATASELSIGLDVNDGSINRIEKILQDAKNSNDNK